MGRLIKTVCSECSTELTLDFGDATFKEALEMIEKMDHVSRECPGFHVEIGGWRKLWNLDEAVNRAYTEEEKEMSGVSWYYRVKIDKIERLFSGENKYAQSLAYIRGFKESYDPYKLKDITVIIQELDYGKKVIKETKESLHHF